MHIIEFTVEMLERKYSRGEAATLTTAALMMMAFLQSKHPKWYTCVIFFFFPDMRVSDSRLLGPEFSRNGKENITVRNLLLHNAGFPPDPNPNYCE